MEEFLSLQAHTLRTAQVSTQKKAAIYIQVKKRFSVGTDLLVPWSSTSQPLEEWEISMCCLSADK